MLLVYAERNLSVYSPHSLCSKHATSMKELPNLICSSKNRIPNATQPLSALFSQHSSLLRATKQYINRETQHAPLVLTSANETALTNSFIKPFGPSFSSHINLGSPSSPPHNQVSGQWSTEKLIRNPCRALNCQSANEYTRRLECSCKKQPNSFHLRL